MILLPKTLFPQLLFKKSKHSNMVFFYFFQLSLSLPVMHLPVSPPISTHPFTLCCNYVELFIIPCSSCSLCLESLPFLSLLLLLHFASSPPFPPEKSPNSQEYHIHHEAFLSIPYWKYSFPLCSSRVLSYYIFKWLL